MSFKFKLGALVEKVEESEDGLHRVIGLLLDGYINIRSLKTHTTKIVNGEEYKRVEIPIEEYDY